MPLVRVSGAGEDLPIGNPALLHEMREWLYQSLDTPGVKQAMEYGIQQVLRRQVLEKIGRDVYIDVLVEKVGHYGDSAVVLPQNMRTLLAMFDEFPYDVPMDCEVFAHDGLTWHLHRNSIGIVYKVSMRSERY